MIIALKKFGTTLISRPAGREAYAAFQPVLNGIGSTEPVEVNFTGILTFSPSWGDEFLTPLQTRFGDRLRLRTSDNLSVKATLKILAQTNKRAWQLI